MAKFKTRKKYRLTFINENTFNAVWTVKLSRAKVWALSALTIAAIAALILWLATATPLSALLPGYLKPSQRAEHINNTLRVDSLSEVLARNSAWLQNVTEILDGTIEQQLDSAAVNPAEAPTVADTLLAASEAERAFVEKWNARERYTLSVLTPLTAEVLSFHSPVAGAKADTLLTKGAVKTLRMTAPRGVAVTAVAPGTVTSVTHDDTRNYSVTVQHPDNLLSVISGVAYPTVDTGRRIQSGEAIGHTEGAPIFVTIWLDGTSIDPRTLLP